MHSKVKYLKTPVVLLTLALLVSLGAGVVFVQRALAADTWTVDPTLPDNSLCVSPTFQCNSIQAAIDAAADGDTINVLAGTYTAPLNIDSFTGLTVSGADRDTVIVQPTSTLAWNACGHTTDRNAAFRVVNSTGVTLENMTLDLDLVKANYVFGLLYCNSTGTIHNNVVKNLGVPDVSGGYYELGADLTAPGYTSGSPAGITVSNNTFIDTGRLGVVTHYFVNATFTGNTFYKTWDDFGYAIEIGGPSVATITGNTIYGFDTPALSDGSESAGIYIENAFTSSITTPTSKPVLVANNEIYNSQYGMWIGNGYNNFAGDVDIQITLNSNNIHDNTAGGVWIQDEDKEHGSSVMVTGTGNTLAGNGTYGYNIYTEGDGDITVDLENETITGHTYGVYQADNSTLSSSIYSVAINHSEITGNTTGWHNAITGAVTDNAEFNWWGAATGPAHASNPHGAGALGNPVSGDVDFQPWYATGTTTPLTEFVTVTHNPVIAVSDSIQGGVDAAVPGDTVDVAAGTYVEQVVVNKSLTLTGAGASTTHIVARPAASRTLFTLPETTTTSWDPVVIAFGGTRTGGAISGNGTIAFTMSGFHINGNNDAQASPRYAGILLRNTNPGTVSTNVVDGLAPAAGNPQTGGIFVYGDSNATVSSNTVSTHRRIGIVANGDGAALPDPVALISGNTVNGLGPTGAGSWAENGIQIGNGATGTISGNTVTGHSFAGTSYYSASSILIFQASGTVNVTGNTVIDGQAAVYWLNANGSISSNNISVTAPFAVCVPCNGEIDGIIADPGGAGGLIPVSPFDEPAAATTNLHTNEPDAPDATYTIAVNDNVVTGLPSTGSYGSGGLWVVSYAPDTLDFSGTRNAITGWDYGVYFYNETGSGLNANGFTCNNLSGNAQYGVYNDTNPLVTIDVENNWWGSASGPSHPTLNPAGTGSRVGDNLDFSPWLAANIPGGCTTPSTGSWLNVRTGLYDDLQDLLNSALPGDEIRFMGTDVLPGGANANLPGVTINLNGGTFGPGSPFLTVTAADVTLLGPGVLNGGGSADPAILVQSGGNNFTLKDVEVRNWADAVEVAANVTSFKLIGNFIHDNTDAGLQVDSGVSISGVVTIEGNLFKDNGGNGVQNSGNTLNLPAGYNSWGDYAGPTGALGDGVGGSVAYAPWTFAEIFLDVDPDSLATQRDVLVDDTFNVKLKLDARNLYGVAFSFTYDVTRLTLNSTTFTAPWVDRCLPVPGTPVGEVAYACNLIDPDVEYTANPGDIATFNFTANGTGLVDPGPWTALFDIAHHPADTNSGAVGGVRIYVNNAGFKAPSILARDITDPNDGRIDIADQSLLTGFINLQGRFNDSGAFLRVYNQSTKIGATELANATSAAGGGYTTAYISPYELLLGDTYWLYVDAPLYLPTTVVSGASYANSKLMDQRPEALGLVLLLGGDATNDDVIDISDAACIGGDYGTPNNTCSTGSSNVNGEGSVDLLDLVLMGGNYQLSSSPWTP